MALSRHHRGCEGGGPSARPLCTSSRHSRRGIFSTPHGVRRGWSLSSAAMHDGRPGTAGVALSRHHKG
eukprot:7666320-Pyramimonas_sp.AAC.1